MFFGSTIGATGGVLPASAAGGNKIIFGSCTVFGVVVTEVVVVVVLYTGKAGIRRCGCRYVEASGTLTSEGLE